MCDEICTVCECHVLEQTFSSRHSSPAIVDLQFWKQYRVDRVQLQIIEASWYNLGVLQKVFKVIEWSSTSILLILFQSKCLSRYIFYLFSRQTQFPAMIFNRFDRVEPSPLVSS